MRLGSRVFIGEVPAPQPPGNLSDRTLVVQASTQARYARTFSTGYRVAVNIVDARNVDPAVFLFLARPPLDGVQYASFQKVCSPADLQQFPALEPYSDTTPNWFRMPAITLDFRDQATATTALSLIMAQLQVLLDSIDREQELATGSAATTTGSNPFNS